MLWYCQRICKFYFMMPMATYVSIIWKVAVFGTGNRNIIPPLYGADLVKHTNEEFLEDLRNYIGGNGNKVERILHYFRE